MSDDEDESDHRSYKNLFHNCIFAKNDIEIIIIIVLKNTYINVNRGRGQKLVEGKNKPKFISQTIFINVLLVDEFVIFNPQVDFGAIVSTFINHDFPTSMISDLGTQSFTSELEITIIKVFIIYEVDSSFIFAIGSIVRTA